MRRQEMSRTPIHAGEILGDELDEAGLTARKLAEILQLPPDRLDEMLAGQRDLSADTALRAQKHDVDLGVGLVNPLDWLNVLVLLRSHGYEGPFNLDFKPPRTTSNHGVFKISFPTSVDRFITLWEIAGEAISDPVIAEATDALKEGGGGSGDVNDIVEANRELLSLHELIAHRLFQILIGQHRGRTFSV